MADHEKAFELARQRVREEQEAERALKQAILTRDEAVLTAYHAAPEEWSDNAIARALGMNASTMRSIIPRSERRANRRARAASQE